jgi:acetyl-CoA acyltransferase 2
MAVKPVYIVGGARTPMGEYVGALKDIGPCDLGAIAVRAALERSGVSAEIVDHFVFGNVLQTGGSAIYDTRYIALKSGIPVKVPTLTVNRLCGSGIQAAVSGAQMIQLDEADLVLAGGVESMSQAPHVIPGLRSGLRLGQGQLRDSLWDAVNDPHSNCSMGVTAENCAAKYGISREAQDCFAFRSHQLAARSWANGRFSEEVVPVEVKSRKGVEVFASDDHVRPDTTLESLAKLRSVFSITGTVTAGNASGIVDGAAAVVLASARAVADYQLNPIGRIIGWACVGVEPTLMGMGPVPATHRLLEKTGLKISDLDLFEVNEAFAAQYLAVEKELHLDRDLVNVNGGAIALGHPLGMTGIRQILTLLLELRRRGKRRGLATACIGGGQGISAIVEAA